MEVTAGLNVEIDTTLVSTGYKEMDKFNKICAQTAKTVDKMLASFKASGNNLASTITNIQSVSTKQKQLSDTTRSLQSDLATLTNTTATNATAMSKLSIASTNISSKNKEIATSAIQMNTALNASQNATRNLTSALERQNTVMTMVKGAFATLATGLTIRGLHNLTTTFAELEDRAMTSVKSMDQISGRMKQLFDVSQNTNKGFASTVKLFSDVQLASRQLGMEDQKLVRFTELLNKSFELTGTSADESQRTIKSFITTLASGKTDVSVIDGMIRKLPTLAVNLSNAFGMSIENIKVLAQAGKISSKDLVNAILSQGKVIDASFSQTSTKVADSITNIRNSVLFMIGTFNNVTGASNIIASALKGVSQAMDFLTKNAETIVNILNALAYAALPALISKIPTMTQALGSLKTMFIGLKAVIAANPFAALAIAIGFTIGLLVSFRNQIKPISTDIATLGDYMTVIGDKIKNAWLSLWGTIKGVFEAILNGIKIIYSWFEKLGNAVKNILHLSTAFDTLKTSLGGLTDPIAKAFTGLRTQANEAARLRLETEKLNASLKQQPVYFNEIAIQSKELSTKAKKDFQSLATSVGHATTSILSMVDSLANSKDPLQIFTSSMQIVMTILNTIGGLFGPKGFMKFANGGVFSPQGQVTAFAGGGIVNQPTPFMFGNNNLGVMGEAGPEAIMPLKRKNGKLGIATDGNNNSNNMQQTINITMNINTQDAKSFQSNQSAIAAQMYQQMKSSALRNQKEG